MFRNRCCCFFKRKKKRSGRVKWLMVVRSNKEKEAVTLLHTISQSNSRDSILNAVATWIRRLANRYPVIVTFAVASSARPSQPFRAAFGKYRFSHPRRCYFVFSALAVSELNGVSGTSVPAGRHCKRCEASRCDRTQWVELGYYFLAYSPSHFLTFDCFLLPSARSTYAL